LGVHWLPYLANTASVQGDVRNAVSVDSEFSMWQNAEPMRSREAIYTVSGDILHSVGKGFLIACAGMVLGAVFGGSALVAGSTVGLVAIGTAGITGMACMFASSVAYSSCRRRREQCDDGYPDHDACEERSPLDFTPLPVEELAEPAESEGRFARRVRQTDGLRDGKAF
jgi:hypothetical protein